MATEITPIIMPKWGLEMRQGTVHEWLVSEGDRIETGQPLVDVETDKISNAVEAADPGLLRRIVATSGEVLPVKALLAVMAEPEVSDADIDKYIAAYEVPAGDTEDEEDEPGYLYLDVDNTRIRYVRRGPQEGVPVLLIHGFGGDLNNWLFNIDALAGSHPVIAFDLPAHGQSSIALPGTTLGDLAGFVARFMAAVDVASAHLVGHSLGGAIAMRLALDFPDKAASLALIDSAGFGDEINGDYTGGFIRATSRRELKPVAQLLFANADLVNRQLLDDLLKYKRLDGVTEALTALDQHLFAGGRQAEQPGSELEHFGKPVLVIWGQDDQIIPSTQTQAAPAGARVEVLAGAGHMPQMEKANDVNALLEAHLQTPT
uniref:acetoin dehydrogenase dihydrolipoyllysine-residue acetyltransferase subunit n=1 Tax=Castellaniella defragrans TaxID=75697 RepID=UPI003340482A